MSHASEFTEINGHGISREPQCEVVHCRFYLRECLHGDRAAWWILTLIRVLVTENPSLIYLACFLN
uniref:Uncharacterized protein n=1 Tax=Anguilla anguilla TaxID=7936 RepID=A0A0E9SVQ8_ANGAN